jgi:predicted enzyme related to lactoylglutathione lyase/ferritin-like metal-binding protein YciE/predicted ester cyclase
MLEEQTARLDDDTALHKSLTLHLQKTRRHAALLAQRLQQMGEDISAVRPAPPVTAAIGRANGGKPDTARQTELLDYVAESFEVASYRALQSLAEMLGDQQTGRVCEQILVDELAITDALGRRVPTQNGHKNALGVAVDGNLALAREIFAALNAHDLAAWDRLVGRDFRAELPARIHPLDWEESRAWLTNYFDAFPDLRHQLNRVAASGDSAFVEWSAAGTHKGVLRLRNGHSIPASDRKVRFEGIAVFRFLNDRLSHARVVMDPGRLLHQLGAAPEAMQAASPTASSAKPLDTAGRPIVHLEIPALDRRIAARFYSQLLEWDYEHMDEPVNYTTFQSGTLRGGFPDADRMSPAAEVLFYVYSKDIESDLQRAESLGGKVVVPVTEIPGRGHFAIVSDPSGNRFGLLNMDRSQ